ncbi:MAG: hypothetical protein ACRD09_04540 [Vicinamibacterales bacterium]
MDTHVKVLGVLHIVLGALGVFGALVLMLAFGSAGGIVGASADPDDARIALPIIGLAGAGLVAFVLLTSVPGIVAGWGLLKFRPWARILAIVLSIFALIMIPLGTIVGVYGLWVLLNKDTERLFMGAPPQPQVP